MEVGYTKVMKWVEEKTNAQENLSAYLLSIDHELNKEQADALSSAAIQFMEGVGRVAMHGFSSKQVKKRWEKGTKKLEMKDGKGLKGDVNNSLKLPSNIDLGHQGKHIKGHNNFIQGKSILTADPQMLLNGVNAGKYTILRKNQNNLIVDFGEPIGAFFKKGEPIGLTRFGAVHYGKNSVHIVPANPNQY